MQHWCPIFVHTHQTLGQLEIQATTTLNKNQNLAHHLIASLIRTFHIMMLKQPQNGFWRASLLLLVVVNSLRGNIWKHSSWSGVTAVFTKCTCSCPLHGICLHFYCQTLLGIVKTAHSVLFKSASQISQQQWRYEFNSSNILIQIMISYYFMRGIQMLHFMTCKFMYMNSCVWRL